MSPPKSRPFEASSIFVMAAAVKRSAAVARLRAQDELTLFFQSRQD